MKNPCGKKIYLILQFVPSTSVSYPISAFDNFYEAEKWCDIWNEKDGDGPVRYMVKSLQLFETESEVEDEDTEDGA